MRRSARAAFAMARMAMRSTRRWCSDGREFARRDGDIIRLAPVTDVFDREVAGWMREAAGKRFAATRTRRAAEHLSDNGAALTARGTGLFAQAPDLTPCFAPVASRSGPYEAFLRTLKRRSIRCRGVRTPEPRRGSALDGSRIASKPIHDPRSK